MSDSLGRELDWKECKSYWLKRSFYSDLVPLDERRASNERKRVLKEDEFRKLEEIDNGLGCFSLPHIFEVKICNEIGSLGLFATKEIQAGEFLGLYASAIIPVNAKLDSQYRFSFTNRHSLDASDCGNYTRFLNSAYPGSERNVRAELVCVNGFEEIGFWAMKPILSGQQCLVYYGEGYFKTFGIEPVALKP